jgi:hypothetical protein
MTTKFAAAVNQYFYFFMSILIALVVAYGFSHTVGERMLHPTVRPPSIVWVHAALFSGWVLFFIFQSALVRTRNVKIHRMTGWFGVALATSMVVVGLITSVVMTRFEMAQHHDDRRAFMMVPFSAMFCFALLFALAIYWRKKPEYHRRLMLLASCVLTSAAFGRFPAYILPHIAFFAGVDALLLLGVARDLIVNRRIHEVYRYAVPLFLAMEVLVMYTVVHGPAWWVNIATALLR